MPGPFWKKDRMETYTLTTKYSSEGDSNPHQKLATNCAGGKVLHLREYFALSQEIRHFLAKLDNYYY